MEKLIFGAIAGAVFAVGFTLLHNLMISEIWFMLVSMLIAGAICGVGFSWSYALLVPNPSGSSSMRYNLIRAAVVAGV